MAAPLRPPFPLSVSGSRFPSAPVPGSTKGEDRLPVVFAAGRAGKGQP